MQGWAIRAVGVLGIAMAGCVAVLIGWALIKWLEIELSSPAKTEALMQSAGMALLIGLASSYMTKLFSNKD